LAGSTTGRFKRDKDYTIEDPAIIRQSQERIQRRVNPENHEGA
jgi:hypothetical protein